MLIESCSMLLIWYDKMMKHTDSTDKTVALRTPSEATLTL